MSLRLAVARQHGLDEAMAGEVDRYESSDLAERHKVALRLADALMTLPGSISAELREQAEQHFSRDEILELTLDVMKWNYQKVAVALGTDAEVTPGQLTDLAFEADGRPTI
jgi:alkylhydroperoxidase family enzyme